MPTTALANKVKQNFPAELRAAKLWVLWRLEDVTDPSGKVRKRCKVPKRVINLHNASTTNPEHWSTFEEAARALSQLVPAPEYAAEENNRGLGCVIQPPYVGCDLDHVYDPETGDIEQWAKELIARYPSTYTELTPSNKGFHLWWRLAEGVTVPEQFKNGKHGDDLEVYPGGRYFTVTGVKAQDKPRECTPLTDEYAISLLGEVEKHGQAKKQGEKRLTSARLDELMTSIDFPDLSAAVWALLCQLAYVHGDDHEKIRAQFEQSALYLRTHWNKKWHRQGGFAEAQIAKAVNEAKAHPRRSAAELLSLHVNKAAAERFSELYGENWRYVYSARNWLFFNGSRWQFDEKRSVLQLMDAVASQFIKDAEGAGQDAQKQLFKFVTALHSAEGQRLSVKRAEQLLPALLSEFDLKPYLFNWQNGTYDLELGEFREARREDMLTKCSPARYEPQAGCPRFTRFIEEVLPDESVRRFVQEYAGLSLSGRAVKLIVILLGEKDTRKSTFLNIIRLVLGATYFVTLDFKSLMPHDGLNDPELVDLRGARSASAIESREGQKLDSATIKKLTGLDPIKAAKKFQDHVEFMPTHKLWLASNYAPQVPADDDAMWRRLLKVPFTVSLALDKQDEEFAEKLVAEEGSGIGNWLLEGWQRYWQRGAQLEIPEAVKLATQEMREETDLAREWFNERCEITDQPGDKLLTNAMWQSFESYARKTDLKPRAFTTHLGKNILQREFKHSRNGNYFLGVRFKLSGSPEQTPF